MVTLPRHESVSIGAMVFSKGDLSEDPVSLTLPRSVVVRTQSVTFQDFGKKGTGDPPLTWLFVLAVIAGVRQDVEFGAREEPVMLMFPRADGVGGNSVTFQNGEVSGRDVPRVVKPQGAVTVAGPGPK